MTDQWDLEGIMKYPMGLMATLDAARAAMAAIDTSQFDAAMAAIDTSQLDAVRAAVGAIDTSQLSEAMAAIDTSQLDAVRAAVGAIDTSQLSAAMKAMPRLDPGLFGEAWNERLAEAVGRLKRAEDIITAAPEPARAVEALAMDTDTVRKAARPEVREGMNRWLQIFWIYLAQKLVLDPVLDPTIQGAREAALRIVIMFMVIAAPQPALPPAPAAPALFESGGVESKTEALTLPGGWAIEGLPPIVLRAGPRAAERMVEFFTAQIRNPNTRAAYAKAVTQFFAWCDAHGLDLTQISPIAVATYIEAMQDTYSAPTVKQHLAAIRHLFDWLVVGQVVPANPAASVRGPTHVVRTGKTPVLQPAEARLLLASIDGSDLADRRDRALLAVMVYSFARVSAVVRMDVEDYYQQGKRWWLRLHEKGGKHHALPVHHKAEAYLDAYLDAAGIADETGTPLWRTLTRRREISGRRMSRVDVFQMIKRRVKAAGLGTAANCHTFRATGITAYLLNGGTLERAQAIAAHESPRTTKLYDRTADEVTLEDIEKIGI